MLNLLAAAVVASNLYVVNVVKVYDGDSVTVSVKVWDGLTAVDNVRLIGIDTPEIRGKCPQEKAKAIEARDTLKFLVSGETTYLRAIPTKGPATGKYGRILGTLYTSEMININELMVKRGLARVYTSGKRKGWCSK